MVERVYSSKGKKLTPYPAVMAYSTASVFIDILLSVGVIKALKQHRTGFLQWLSQITSSKETSALTSNSCCRTDRALNRIILYGVATGALTSIFAIVIMLCVREP
ncbi:hypothetical protein DL93DRAFT_2085350 [Clavulina sp. PMI_390]|nr:hypothetical protein DL93DRAFT_2085350 [Clavulina sp. PMI_390]